MQTIIASVFLIPARSFHPSPKTALAQNSFLPNCLDQTFIGQKSNCIGSKVLFCPISAD